MSRGLVMSISVIAATLAGSYAASMFASGHTKSEGPAKEPPRELVKLEAVAVPVIRTGGVQGYVIARAHVTLDAEDAKANKPILQSYAGEAVFRVLFEQGFEFGALKQFEIAKLADEITTKANERIGRPAVKTTVIESINFVAQSEVRQPAPRRP